MITKFKGLGLGMPEKAMPGYLGHPSKKNIVKHGPSQVSQLGSTNWASERPSKASVSGKGQK